MDMLHARLAALVEESVERGEPITETNACVRAAVGMSPVALAGFVTDRPRLTESWFCCAEPTGTQLQGTQLRVVTT
jgi:hypothetical protein